MVESMHRQRIRQSGGERPLQLLLERPHAAPKEVRGVLSAEAVFGQPLILPGELNDNQEASPHLRAWSQVFHIINLRGRTETVSADRI